MRHLLILTVSITLLLAGCAQEPPMAASITAPTGKCSVDDGTALCDGSWASLDAIEDPGSITRIGMTSPTDAQPDLQHFTSLESVVLDSAPLDIRQLPQTVTTVAVLGTAPVTVDQQRTLDRFYLVRDSSAVELFAIQPAKHITGRLNGSTVNLDKLEQSQALKITIDIVDPKDPAAIVDGRTLRLGDGKQQRTITDAFPHAFDSELKLTRTAAR